MNAISLQLVTAQTLASLAYADPDLLDIAECSRLPLYLVAEEFIERATVGLAVSGDIIVDAQQLLVPMIEHGLRQSQEAATERYNAAIHNDTLASLHRHEYYAERLTARDVV